MPPMTVSLKPSSLLSTQALPPSSSVPKAFDLLPPAASIKCRIHPSVVLSILDAFLRRKSEQDQVIGTLLGTVQDSNTVEITDCFTDRHFLTDEGMLQIIKDHHESMFELKQKVNIKEQVVGWFCTGAEMTELTCAVHGWFKQYSNISKFVPHPPLTEPIHLMVDATLENNSLAIQAFLRIPQQVVKEAYFRFQEIPVEMFSNHSERTALSVLLKAQDAKDAANSPADAAVVKDGFHGSLVHLQKLLKICINYVNDVLDGRLKPNVEVGRFLAKALSVDPVVRTEQFEKMCQTAVEDNLVVSHLVHLAKIQFLLAEKLNTSFF